MDRAIAFFLTVLFLVGSLSARAQAAQFSPTAGRLVATARLWGAIKYFDPAVAGRSDVAWDKALVDALPLIESAKTPTEYASAIQAMLSTLDDPSTHVIADSGSATPSGPAFTTSIDKSVAILRVNDPRALAAETGPDTVVTQFAKSAATSSGAVFDLRAGRALSDDEIAGLDGELSTAIGSLVNGTIPMLNPRSLFYQGFPPSTYSSNSYYAGYATQIVGVLAGTAARSLPISVVVNENSEIPPGLLALIRAGRVHIVADGSEPTPISSTTTIPLSDGISVKFRTADFADDGALTRSNLTLIPAGSSASGAMEAAITGLSMPLLEPVASKPSAPPSPMEIPTDENYATTAMPSEQYRVLAAFEIYNAIRYFSPYTTLMHDDWDAALANAIPEVRAAATPLAYFLALSKFYAHLHDSHGFITGPYHHEFFGAGPPIFIRYLHGVPVITDFTDRIPAMKAGAQIGDVVLAIDGESAPNVIKRWQPYINASTPQASVSRVFATALEAGAEGSTVSMLVRTPDGRVKSLHFTRTKFPDFVFRAGPGVGAPSAYCVLAGNVGYVDLGRLREDQVDSMFATLRHTRAIVFDDRSYPAGALGWLIAPRLTSHDRVKAALLEIPLVGNAVSDEDDQSYLPTMIRSYDLLPSIPNKSKYLRPTVLLIDERAQSSAEFQAMMLRAADRMLFVGTPTVGADGDVTNLAVPGDMTLYFSGLSVRWPDGKQTQRVGLLPDVRVEPSARDIAQGSDVVLQAGLEQALRRVGANEAEISKAVAVERKAELKAFKASSVR